MDTYVTPEWIATNERKVQALLEREHQSDPHWREKLGRFFPMNDDNN